MSLEADTDSTHGESMMSQTASLASSVAEFEYENGRRYHSYRAGAYFGPNDEKEQDRMDLIHHVDMMVLNGELFKAPLKDPKRVLDVGTGTGIWAMDMADRYPDAEVIATDFSPIQPEWVPPNLKFEIDDAESDWTYSQKFDFIHLRHMGGSIANWPALLDKCLANLNPGGWIEVADFEAWGSTDDNSLPPDSSYHRWQTDLAKAAEMTGRVMNIIGDMEDLISKAGFKNLDHTVYKVPLSPWPKDKKMKQLGLYSNAGMMEAVETYSMALYTRVLGWKKEDVDVLLDGVRSDLKNLNYHIFSRLHYIIAQKPE